MLFQEPLKTYYLLNNSIHSCKSMSLLIMLDFIYRYIDTSVVV